MELTSKQRSNLRSIASTEDTIMQVGKGGISAALIRSLSDALDKREIIKLSVLENCEDDAKTVGFNLAQSLDATLVATIGRKIILYRRSKRKDVKHLEF